MIGAIAAWLIGKGVSKKFARPLIFAVIAVLALVGFIGSYLLWLSNHDANVIETHENAVQIALERSAREADQNANVRRERRRLAEQEAQQEFNDATTHIPDESLTRRQRIDICIELRDSGTDTTVIPECSDLQSGAEAGPDTGHSAGR